MSYNVVVPFGGYTGWTFLNRTKEAQMAAFSSAAANQTDETYFRERIGTINSADELVSDYRLLKVTLGAFGLSDDINSKFFLKKVLEEGMGDRAALANRLSNKQYAKMAEAFDFPGAGGPNTTVPGFAERILESYRTLQFEVAVGAQNEALRLALNAERELPELAVATSSENTKWYAVLGAPPLRSFMETAFGLPKEFPALDIDRQLAVMKTKSAALLGTSNPADFADPVVLDKLIRTYLARSSIVEGTSFGSGAGTALQILEASRRPATRLQLLL